MNEADFYKILNVSPAASAEKIRSAHRRLVKQYHPDLYSTDGDKARANEALRQINDAYRILSNPERRREYDRRRTQQASSAKPTSSARSTASKPRPTAKAPRARPIASVRLRSLLQSEKARLIRSVNDLRSGNWNNFAKRWNDPAALKWAGGIFGAIALALLIRAAFFPAHGWVLLDKTTIENSRNLSRQALTAGTWDLVGRYSSQSACVDSLRKMVRIDEQAGGKALLDENDGTTASTVYLKDEAALAEDLFNARLKQATPEAMDQQSLRDEARRQAKDYVASHGLPQRVRNYRCQVIEIDGWLRGWLKRTGLIE